jgi:hypothetical protein
MEASHFDPLTAYAAVNTFRLDDLRAHIYRTRDGGKTWAHITAGIPDGGIVNAVREDPRRRGLLFAGTEQAVYVSFDDGERWQSLRLNMPATSVRDLVVKDDDLVVGTHGRSFWILDDITPLRQVSATALAAEAHLFAPQTAWRVRWNMNPDTPLPQEEPAGENPPDGAILHYWLKAPARGPVALEILAGDEPVRRFASGDPPEEPVAGRNIPDYWIRPPQPLSAAAGLHRFVWDLHYPPPAVLDSGYPIAAIYRDTPRVPQGPWVPPGAYTVRLTVNGQVRMQPLVVRMDPRVKTPPEALAQQFSLSMALCREIARLREALDQVRRLRKQVAERKAQAGTGLVAEGLAGLDRKAAALEGELRRFPPPAEGGGTPSLSRLISRLASLYDIAQDADAAPTPQAEAAARDLDGRIEAALARWSEMMSKDVAALNESLKQAGLLAVAP